jgi:hypothetical protein
MENADIRGRNAWNGWCKHNKSSACRRQEITQSMLCLIVLVCKAAREDINIVYRSQ